MTCLVHDWDERTRTCRRCRIDYRTHVLERMPQYLRESDQVPESPSANGRLTIDRRRLSNCVAHEFDARTRVCARCGLVDLTEYPFALEVFEGFVEAYPSTFVSTTLSLSGGTLHNVVSNESNDRPGVA